MFDFFKKICKSKGIKIAELNEIDGKKEKFLRYMNLVESSGDNKILFVNYLISVIVENLNFSEVIQALETPKRVQNNSLIEEIYIEIENEVSLNHYCIIIDKIHEEDKKHFNIKGVELIDEEPLKIKINEFPILLNPWNGERVLNNLVEINEDNIFDGMRYSFNIQNHYIYPMNIIVCSGGNHSQLAARMKNQGYTIIKELHDYSRIYGLVEFDGENYIKSFDKTIIELNYDDHILFYSGVIFEMGRYILENKYHSLNLTKEKFK